MHGKKMVKIQRKKNLSKKKDERYYCYDIDTFVFVCFDMNWPKQFACIKCTFPSECDSVN